MNNNEKKVKYFLRKSAYGLVSMSAAFIVCSGIVNTPTVSAESVGIDAKPINRIEAKSVNTINAISIPKQLTEAKNRAYVKINTHPSMSDQSVQSLADIYRSKVYKAVSVDEVDRLVEQFYNEINRKKTDVTPEEASQKIDELSVTGLTMMVEADEIYQKHKDLLHSHYKDSIGTYTNLFTNRGGVTPWVGAEGLKDAQEAFRKAKVLLANLKALQEQIEKTQKKPVAKGTYDVKYVDTEGKEVAKSRHFEGEEGAAFVISAKEVAGYKLVRTEGAVSNVFTAGAQVRTYVYEKVAKPVAKGTYDVKYVDTEGKEVAKSRHFEGEEGAAFVTSAKEVAGYKLVRTEGAVLNVFTAGAQVRTYVYEKVKPDVKPEAKPE
ncbi:TPA: MucBP domain-containing protein, partial [Streptococcus agalactiae]